MLFSKAALFVVLAFLAGIFFASFLFSHELLSFFLGAAGAALAAVFWGKWKAVWSGLFLVSFALGSFHYASSAQLPAQLSGNLSFEGKVVSFPERDERGTSFVVEAGGVRTLVYASLFEEVGQGDVVVVRGRVQTPEPFEGFDYPMFLAKEGVSLVMFQADVETREKGSSHLGALRESMDVLFDRYFAEPESSLLSAMLLGNKAGLPEEFKEKLNVTGTRHITAISGMHVAILSGMVLVFLLSLGISKKRSSLLTLAFVVFFVSFTGFQASAVRAGIMGSSFLAAGALGRQNTPLRSLAFAACGMLILNPLLLAHDVGFQLSFLAVLGILVFMPHVRLALGSLPNPFGLLDVVAMSVAAQVFTLPLVLHHFGVLSFVSLVTNLLVVPLVPLVLLSGAVFLGAAFFLPALVGVFAFVPGLLLSYISFVVERFSELPFAAGNVEGFSFWILAPFLLGLSWFAFQRNKEERFRFAEQTMLLWKL